MSDPAQDYKLEKQVWDDRDFEAMGWHDATVWSISPNPEAFEFLLDLDYIFKWVDPSAGETYFKFWVAPVTMVFENAHSIRLEIDSAQGTLEIGDLHRGNPTRTPNGELVEHRYRFECQEGEISLSATGFRMYVRQKPLLLTRQSLELVERRGVGFGRALNDA